MKSVSYTAVGRSVCIEDPAEAGLEAQDGALLQLGMRYCEGINGAVALMTLRLQLTLPFWVAQHSIPVCCDDQCRTKEASTLKREYADVRWW